MQVVPPLTGLFALCKAQLVRSLEDDDMDWSLLSWSRQLTRDLWKTRKKNLDIRFLGSGYGVLYLGEGS